jgi:beta-lactamase class A
MRTRMILAVLGAWVLVVAGVLAIRLAPSAAPHAPVPVAVASPARSSATSAAAKARHLVHPPRRDPFGATVRSYLGTRVGAVSGAVYDVASGRTWTIGGSASQAEASIVKLDILETLLAQRRLRGADLSPGEDLLARQMIEDSDNSDATALWYAVGGAAGIRIFNKAAGLVGTSPSLCVDCPGFPWPGWGLTTTTAADQIALLRILIEPNALLTLSERDYVLGLMENVAPDQRWGVSAGVPPGATVALKDGWLPLDGPDSDWQVNSIGWIVGYGRDYLMAVLATGNPTEQYGIDTADWLSAIVWSAMG